MPTYNCWTRAGQLSPEQRKQIARSITRIHHEAARAPRYFVQVIFNELGEHSHFIAGEEAEENHIWIRADIRSGRSAEQKEQLIKRILLDVCDISGAAAENVWVYISDIPGPSVAEYGRILPEPGGEDEWFSQLPEELQDRLRARA